mgnify:CR=1 FL=1
MNNTKEERRLKTLSDNVILLLNEQISHELHNHNVYKTFSNYYKFNGLYKLEKYYDERAEEELVHQRWIIDRLNQCDCPISYLPVKEVEYELSDDLSAPFKFTVDLEIETTLLINNIVKVAQEECDYQTVIWLLETLVKEQHEEEFLSREALKLACVDTDWLTKQEEITDFYKSKEI